MGRGGGRSGGGHSGGRSGGFSSGGSRGFSSRRSSSGGISRGGGSQYSGNRSGGYRSGGFYPNHRRPRSSRPLFGGIFISGLGGGEFSNKTQMPLASSPEPGNHDSAGIPPFSQENVQGSYQGNRKRGGIPGWYMVLMAMMVIFSAMLFWNAAAARKDAARQPVREKLPESACITEDIWIDDSIHWLGNDSSVREAMKYFQKQTGIQPYLLITDNLNGKGGNITDEEAESYLAALYDSLYSDEGHMIFTFMEYAPSQYITYLYTGTAADSVMDSDARNLFLDCVDRYYTDSSLSDEEFFEKIFLKSADQIMADTAGHARAAFLYAVCGAVVLILMAAGLILFKIQEKKAAEAETLKDILNTPVGLSPEEEELKQKYKE